jgi:hypothetical protein
MATSNRGPQDKASNTTTDANVGAKPLGAPEEPETVEDKFGGQPPADPPGVTRNADGSIDSPPISLAAARNAPDQGWEVGNAAPEDRYVGLNERGEVTGKVQSEPVQGYGRQLVAKGDVITQAIADQLAAVEG